MRESREAQLLKHREKKKSTEQDGKDLTMQCKRTRLAQQRKDSCERSSCTGEKCGCATPFGGGGPRPVRRRASKLKPGQRRRAAEAHVKGQGGGQGGSKPGKRQVGSLTLNVRKRGTKKREDNYIKKDAKDIGLSQKDESSRGPDYKGDLDKEGSASGEPAESSRHNTKKCKYICTEGGWRRPETPGGITAFLR